MSSVTKEYRTFDDVSRPIDSIVKKEKDSSCNLSKWFGILFFCGVLMILCFKYNLNLINSIYSYKFDGKEDNNNNNNNNDLACDSISYIKSNLDAILNDNLNEKYVTRVYPRNINFQYVFSSKDTVDSMLIWQSADKSNNYILSGDIYGKHNTNNDYSDSLMNIIGTFEFDDKCNLILSSFVLNDNELIEADTSESLNDNEKQLSRLFWNEVYSLFDYDNDKYITQLTYCDIFRALHYIKSNELTGESNELLIYDEAVSKYSLKSSKLNINELVSGIMENEDEINNLYQARLKAHTEFEPHSECSCGCGCNDEWYDFGCVDCGRSCCSSDSNNRCCCGFWRSYCCSGC